MIMETPGLVTPDIQKDSYIVGRCSLEAYDDIKGIIKDSFDEKEFEPFLMYNPDTGDWNIGLSVSNKKPEPIAKHNAVNDADIGDDMLYFFNKMTKHMMNGTYVESDRRQFNMLLDQFKTYWETRLAKK